MNKFSRLFKDRQLTTPEDGKATDAESKPAVKQIAEAKPESSSPNQQKTKTTRRAKAGRPKNTANSPVKLTPKTKSKKKKQQQPKADNKKPRKRGRPANGKRSDPNWFGRTFYIRKQTDDLLESALFKLKREGIELDKSQLVDALLNAWSQVELEQAKDFCIGEILERPNTESEED